MQTVRINIGITDAREVWRRAVRSYLADGNCLSDVLARFGTACAPKLVECVTEICAEADHGGLFDFLD